ncbi:MAG: amidase family protein [Pseudomonadales bacterium]|jgi:amidase|nr:amidase family protein [Pseudomonadales bacterium]
MNRLLLWPRLLVLLCAVLGATACDESAMEPAAAAAPEPFDVVEATIPEMQAAMSEGRLTSRELVAAHLLRIALHEDAVNAVMDVNDHALEIADRLDAERAAGRVRGPLHGIPIALKDNILTRDVPTTGGALAFEGYVPPYEATLTELLREAGAVIIAKTVMTELANFMASGMPGNYSAVGGYGLNPYDPRRDPREGRDDGRPVMGVGGSSSGIGTAVSFWAANVGTETSGSILSPSNANMLAAVKPTVGRVSRWGVIPITADQDTAGPMARTVTDAAILLGALEGAEPDPKDPATGRCARPESGDYTQFLDAGALAGARIGIPRAFYYDPVQVPGEDEARGWRSDAERAAMAEAIGVLREAGAVIVDPADIPSVVDPDPERNLLAAPRSSVLDYGMKRDFDAWLATLGDTAPVRSLTELREWNLAHRDAGALKYEQARLDGADEIDLEADRSTYEADRSRDLELNGAEGIDAALARHELDALLFPGSGGAGIAARPGYPTVIVPFARVEMDPREPWPEGFEPASRPFGVSFTGTACSEPRLLALAYAFEQATQRREAPAAFR